MGAQPGSTAIPAFTLSYVSPEQTITLGGSLTLAHGLGAKPKIVQVWLKCGTTDLGYSVGDELPINAAANSNGGSNEGMSVVPDSTNLNVRFGSSALKLFNKGSGAGGAITSANWTAIFKAYY